MNPFGDIHQNKLNVNKYFTALIDFLENHDSVKLIIQLTLTYLFHPGNEYKTDTDEIHKWSRWIEFISAYYLSKPYNPDAEKFIDGQVIEKLENHLENYFKSVNFYIFSDEPKEKDFSKNHVLIHSKIYSLNVRGDSYPNKLIDLALSLYTFVQDIFHEKFGFSIKDAVELYHSITDEYLKIINDGRIDLINLSKEITKNQINENPELKSLESKIEQSNFLKLFFGMSDVHLSFTKDEIIEFSNKSNEVCTNFLNRMSQTFGYQNPNFPNAFTDPFKAPWEFNTLYEKPIAFYENKYFIPNPSLFPTVLLNTFNYDLITDNKYKDKFNNEKGRWLEVRTAESFGKLFNTKNVIVNPNYPDGNELTDVLILYDRKIFIIQCKSKSLTHKSKIGLDFNSLVSDIQKGVKSSFEQGIKAREYLLSKDFPEIYYSNHKITIDTRQVTDVFLLSVTLGFYQSLMTRIANIDDALNLFDENDYPWAISISDLEVILEIINLPSEFIHYTKQRINLEKTNYNVEADEVDLLNFYLSEDLNFDNKNFEKYNQIILTSFSDDVDRYFFDKYQANKDVQIPKRKWPENFNKLIQDIDNLDISYKSDCIHELLKLDYINKEKFIKNINKTITNAQANKKLYIMYLALPDRKTGFCYLTMNSDKDFEKLYQQIFCYSTLKKYELKFNTWIGIGKDINTENFVDMIVFISFPWIKDNTIEKMSTQYIGKTVNLN